MPPSYIRVRVVVWAYGCGQTDTQTRVTTIHFASSTTHTKCNNNKPQDWHIGCVIVEQLQPASATAAAVSTNTSKKWAGRRRAAPYNKPAAHSATMDKIGQLAEEKKAFYTEKLKMRQAEHRLRMEVLQLKQQYYKQLLEKTSPEA